jgi:HPt (histidine-containing phosphotransfer) domain-containing protein
LAALAHWLKGSGSTAGFDAFTAPARTLEELAKRREQDKIEAVVSELQRIVERISVTTEQQSTEMQAG